MLRDSRRVRALACPFFLLAAYGISGTGQPSWEQCMAEMERFERESDYAQVEKALLAALNQHGQLAPQDPCLAVTLYKLGDVYRVLGRTREAERFYLRALSAGEKSAGANHSSLRETLTTLTAFYLENKQYAKAERFHRRCLEVLGHRRSNDPTAARLLHNLAALYDGHRRYKEAEPLYRQAMASLERTLGPENWEVALVMNNLALLCGKTGRYAEAISYLERALPVWEKTFGPEHPNVAQALSNLGALYCLGGRFTDAEAQFQRALAIAENVLGKQSTPVAKILVEYAVLLRKTRQNHRAHALERRAREIRKDHAHEDLTWHTIEFSDLR